MNIMRAKMRLTAEKIYADSVASGAKVYTFQAQYSDSKEDNSFAKYTPSAKFEMTIDNPEVQAQLKLGETYYVDFTPASFPIVDKVVEYISKTTKEAVVYNDNPVDSTLASEAAQFISQEQETSRLGTGLAALRDEPLVVTEPYKNTPNPNLPPKSYWKNTLPKPQNDFGDN